MSDDKKDALLNALAQIEKSYWKWAIMKIWDKNLMDIPKFSSWSISLDMAIWWGYPQWRIIEIYWPESSGKTTLTLHAIAEIQKKWWTAAFIDAEHALDPSYAEKIWVNTRDLYVSQPDNWEQALEITETLVRSWGVDLIVIDSVAALTPRAEIEGEMWDSHMWLQARLMSQALRKLTAIVSKTKCTVIFINQIRMKIWVMFGSPETTTWWNALKFYSSMRLEVRKWEKIENWTWDQKIFTWNKVKVKVVKNKVAPPFKTAEFEITFNEWISSVWDILDTATKMWIVKKAWAFYSYWATRFWQWRENSKIFIKWDKKLADELFKKIWDEVKKLS